MKAGNILPWGINMNAYVYSAKSNAFFPVEFLEQYESNGWDLSDVVEVDDQIALQYIGDAPVGKVRIAGKDGYPTWGNAPEPTHEELTAEAEAEKQRLIDGANSYMNGKQWSGKAAIGRLKGDELAQYNLWLDYLDALAAVDTSSAPDINWPVPPEM